jgi:hypothetical protein
VSRADGVGALFARRACSALRRYSDFGATENDPVRAIEGRVRSGVDGRMGLWRAESRDVGDVDMFLWDVWKDRVDEDWIK